VEEARNATGRPLASASWLQAHHRAKLAERTRFAATLASLRPNRIVDLGCGTGLWLQLLDSLLPPECEFIGFDSDPEALAVASGMIRGWTRPARFELCDLEADAASIPAADLTLMFNIFPYLTNPGSTLDILSHRPGKGALAVRQYDGDSMRFGPMDTASRAAVESSLRVSTLGSEQFRHYDMDRVFELLHGPWFTERSIGFELFARAAPFPPEFIDYAERTLRWTSDLVSEEAATYVDSWRHEILRRDGSGYWLEADLVAVVS